MSAVATGFPALSALWAAVRGRRDRAAAEAHARRRAHALRLAHARVLDELLDADLDDAARWAVRLTAAIHDATEAEVSAAVGDASPQATFDPTKPGRNATHGPQTHDL